MKVASFNLYQFVAPPFFCYDCAPTSTYSSDQWQAKCNWILAQLHRMDADIIAFQEVFSITALQRLCQQAGYDEFFTVDKPTVNPRQPTVYLKPVVAIAARYPCQAVQAVQTSLTFSRVPIRARFETEFGAILIYAVHLKSKRPDVDAIAYDATLPPEQNIAQALVQYSRGHIAALEQRGLEASHLYQDIVAELLQTTSVLLLGDLNDTPDSIPIRALTRPSGWSIFSEPPSVDPASIDALVKRFQLMDGGVWPINTEEMLAAPPNAASEAPLFSYLHHGHPQRLDYVLASHAFHPDNSEAIAQISDYQVLNEHLLDPTLDPKLASDHGPVVLTLSKT